MWPFKKENKKGNKKTRKPKSLLQTGAIRELKKLKAKRFSTESIEELNKIFHIYLKERYSLNQGLTHEELAKTIKYKLLLG